MQKRQILVTNALPYANGPIHLGHLLGYIGADIWVRAMRSLGHDVVYVCADDAHGTAIMLKAESLGVSPEAQIAAVQKEHERDFAGFFVDFDHYDSTHSDANKKRAEEIYLANKKAGNVSVRPVTQLFDPKKNLFLADRFVKGACPKCRAADQYGDACEVCGSTYNATELIDPKSALSGATPVLKQSDHYFFDLPNFADYLQKWTRKPGRLPASIVNKLDEWFEAGLNDWDISRDAPYFGFEIPDAPGKYFYVWVDAPIGYMASFENCIAKKRPDLRFEDFWRPDSTKEIYHFIGKDIVYFHALFWPAMLHGAGYRTPDALFVNGFLTVNGEKMSKSRGTFIKAETYLAHLDPEYLRYYFACKLSDKVEDSDLHLDDFVAKVNADLVGKVVNLASRCAKFINAHFGNRLSSVDTAADLVAKFAAEGDAIAQCYEKREFGAAVRRIMALADQANQYIDEKKPWTLAKTNPQDAAVQDVCTVGLNLFYQLAIYLAPILPNLAKKAQAFLQVDSLNFADRHRVLGDRAVGAFTPLMQRVDPKKAQAMIDASKESLAGAVGANETANKAATKTDKTAASDRISIDDFGKVRLQAAKVVACERVEGADKLLRFCLDLDEKDSQGKAALRTVFSGIAQFYDPSELQGKTVICVSNLAPRKMKFGVSEGMILSAEKDGKITVILLDDAVQAGATLA